MAAKPAFAFQTVTASPPAVNGAAGTPGQLITVTTDLYRAQIDTTGGTITEVALLKHRDPHDETKPYILLLKTPERTNVAQSGLLGDGMPNHRSVYEALPGPRELAPGADRVDLRLQTTAPNGDKIVQILTFHRGSYVIDVAYDITNNASAPVAPYAYFQFARDIKAEGSQNSMAPVSYRRGRSSTTRPTSSRRSSSATWTSSPPIPRASSRTRRTPTTAGSGWSSTISSLRG